MKLSLLFILCSFFYLFSQDSIALVKFASFPKKNFSANKYDSILEKYSKPDSTLVRNDLMINFMNHTYQSKEFIYNDFDLAYAVNEDEKPIRIVEFELKNNLSRSDDLPRWLQIGKTSFEETMRNLVDKGIKIDNRQIELTTLDSNGKNVKITLFFNDKRLARVKWNF